MAAAGTTAAGVATAIRYRRPFGDGSAFGVRLTLRMSDTKRSRLRVCFYMRPALRIGHALGVRLTFGMRLAVGVRLALAVRLPLAGAISLGGRLRHQSGE